MGIIKIDTLRVINFLMLVVTGVMLVLVTWGITRTDNARAELVGVNMQQDKDITDLKLRCQENDLVIKSVNTNLTEIKLIVNSINRKMDKHLQGEIDAKR